MDVYAPYTNGNPRRIPLDSVEKFTLADYGFSVDAVKGQMFGVRVVDPESGEELGDDYYIQAINSAIANAEKVFDIKILPRFESEEKDFYQSDFNSFGYLKMNSRPVLQVEDFQLRGYNQNVMQYQNNWWKVNCIQGSVQLMPSLLGILGGTGGVPYNQLSTGQAPWLGFPPVGLNQGYAPQLFHVNYVAGMLPQERDGVFREWELHPDLKFLILKQSAKSILEIWGRLIIGAGIASKSFSMDGIEESVVTTQSAMYGGASADILQLDQDINQLTAGLKSYYGLNVGIV